MYIVHTHKTHQQTSPFFLLHNRSLHYQKFPQTKLACSSFCSHTYTYTHSKNLQRIFFSFI
ncbi:hypothetical protein BDC45DRAFT_208500 [Circinella umbellata]|nr:hypothetical protein BDC45DRAFT_208500 [Circinella umbellata]